jgi:hypothetical protein
VPLNDGGLAAGQLLEFAARAGSDPAAEREKN